MMMKKNWKNRKGVSPVIATILMVAITVVLAAVLYVMVMGFGGTSGNAPSTQISKDVSGHYVVSINPATDLAKMKFSVNTTVGADMSTMAGRQVVSGTGTHMITVDFLDVGADGKVTSGDYFTVTKATATDTATLTLLWINGDQTQAVTTLTV
jgi:archaeal type IV pilus assembly protein PilA